MSSQDPTYSVSVTSDELQAMKESLYLFCVCQSKAFDSSAENLIGLGRPSRRLLITIAVVGSVLSGLLLAMTTANEVLARVFLGGMTIFFCLYFLAQLVPNRDWLKQAFRRLFTHPLIRWTVNLEMDRAIRRAPFSVDYRFLDTSYAASSPEMKTDRTILADDVSIAYRADPVFCLFQRKTSQHWKSIIYAPEPKHRNIVEAFLKDNHIDLLELDIPPVSVVEDDVATNS